MVKSKPPWVDAELVAMGSGTVKLDSSLWNTGLGTHVKGWRGEKTMELFYQMQQERMILDRSLLFQ
jgi:hypothetical protein